MNNNQILLIGVAAAAVALGGCGQGPASKAEAADVKTAAVAKPKKVPYCFYKDENAKGWTASVGKDGAVTVSGKAYLADGRYKAAFKPVEIDGTTASVQLAMPQNDTGHSTRDGWWDVSTTIPASAGVTKVEVLCGERTEASLEVAAKG
jgi:hypothetical protein